MFLFAYMQKRTQDCSDYQYEVVDIIDVQPHVELSYPKSSFSGSSVFSHSPQSLPEINITKGEAEYDCLVALACK